MRSKNILSIAAFLAAFAFSTAFAGLFIEKSEFQLTLDRSYFNHDARISGDISALLYRDISNGRERDRRLYRLYDIDEPFSETGISVYAETVDVYSANSANLRDSHLPPDFQIAWRKHMRAWRHYSNFLAQFDKNPEMLEFERNHESRKRYIDEIDSTRYEVLRIGRTYGVNVPY